MIDFLNVSIKNCVLFLILLSCTAVKTNANNFFYVTSFGTADYSMVSACLSTVGMSQVVSANVEPHSSQNGNTGLSCHVVYDNDQNAWFPIHLISCVPGTQYSGNFKLYCDIKPNNGGGGNNTCNPINISTGNKYFHVNESNGKLPFSRYYNSFENGWSFSYQAQLIIESTFIVAQRSDGKPISFDIEGSNFIAPSQPRERLIFDGSVYTLWLSDNSHETYDTSGRLLSINYLHNEPISLAYAGNQITVSQSGDNLVLTVNENNQIIQATLPDSSVINYSYSDNNGYSILSMVTYPNSFTEQYLYEDTRFPAHITGVVDQNNNRISSVQYDSQGRAISSEKGYLNSGVELTQIQYNSVTRTLTNSLDKQTTYYFNQFNGEYKITQVDGHASANCAAANQAYTYDANGFMASSTDWQGNITTYIHNDRGQELSRTEASGTSQARTITTEWHPQFNLPVRIIEPERETVMTYDANGRLLSREVEVVE